MRYLTAGESHGEALCGIVEGLPAGLKVDVERINAQLKRRQSGYGRGGRMKIESDTAKIIAGLRGGFTTGAPIAFLIENRDFENWTKYMSATGEIDDARVVTKVRPGHADLTGCIKYGFDDARNVLERASARNTAADVAVGSLCRQLLESVGIEIGSHVLSIGGVPDEVSPRTHYGARELIERADDSSVRCMDKLAQDRMIEAIDAAKRDGDTLGGRVEIVVSGVPAGLGSYVCSDKRLDGLLAGAFVCVQAIKEVEIGEYLGGRLPGSAVGDEIVPETNGGYRRLSNHAGGIEGGMSNGGDIVIRATMKPIPTLMNGLKTIDIRSGEAAVAAAERSDVCAVPAAAVVLESVAARVIAEQLLVVTGGDTITEVAAAVERLREKAKAAKRTK